MSYSLRQKDPMYYAYYSYVHATDNLRFRGYLAVKELEKAIFQYPRTPETAQELPLLLLEKAFAGDELAYKLLLAYLDETAFYKSRQLTSQYYHLRQQALDVLSSMRVAVMNLDKLFQGYDPKRGSVTAFASMRLPSLVLPEYRNLLPKFYNMSDFAILTRYTPETLTDWLVAAGESQAAERVALFEAFQDNYDPAPGYRKLPPPRPEELNAIASSINKSPTEVSQLLQQSVQLIRHAANSTVVSLDSNDYLQDTLVIEENLGIEYRVLMPELEGVMREAIASLTPQDQTLLEQYYGQKLRQGVIAKTLNQPQYWVSRRLKHLREVLAEAIALWSENKGTSLKQARKEALEPIIGEWLAEVLPSQVA